MTATSTTHATRRRKTKSGFWKKQARIWHWMSGAVCLLGMLLFAFTGITLNHASDISAAPKVTTQTLTLPGALLDELKNGPIDSDTTPLPRTIRRHLNAELSVNLGTRPGEWTDIDVYVALPRPGGDSWLAIDRETGMVEFENTKRGAIAYLNDLHKGRNAGRAWAIFLDVFSIATILFCLTGLWLLQIHSGKRATTWPLTLAGLAIPALIALIFIH